MTRQELEQQNAEELNYYLRTRNAPRRFIGGLFTLFLIFAGFLFAIAIVMGICEGVFGVKVK